MERMQYGSNWLSMQSQISDSRKQKLIVSAKAEKEIQAKIRTLQNDRDALYNDYDMSDAEIADREKPINDAINKLIDSMYETPAQAKKRCSR